MIAVKFLPIRKCELCAFDLQMDKFRSCRVETVEIKALQQGQLLQHHGTLAPNPGLANRVTAVVIREWRLNMGLPSRHVIACKDAAMTLTGDVHDVLCAA